jgi:hypothetical protein
MQGVVTEREWGGQVRNALGAEVRLTVTQRRRIAAIWGETDDCKMSTESLFALTADRATEEFRREVDAGDVSDALRDFAEFACPGAR